MNRRRARPARRDARLVPVPPARLSLTSNGSTPFRSTAGGSTCGAALRHERGSVMISAPLGVLFVIVFLLFTVQVLLSLYARSLVSAAAFDAARLAATSAEFDTGAATQRADQLIGSMKPQLDWSATTDDEVVLTVIARGPTLFPQVASLVGLGHVERTARLRRERWR